jgi:hypothetical protein
MMRRASSSEMVYIGGKSEISYKLRKIEWNMIWSRKPEICPKETDAPIHYCLHPVYRQTAGQGQIYMPISTSYSLGMSLLVKRLRKQQSKDLRSSKVGNSLLNVWQQFKTCSNKLIIQWDDFLCLPIQYLNICFNNIGKQQLNSDRKCKQLNTFFKMLKIRIKFLQNLNKKCKKKTI